MTQAAFTNDQAIALANVFNGIASDVASAEAATLAAKGCYLPALAKALKGVQPVTQEIWDRTSEAAFKVFSASPRFSKVDAKGVSLAARARFSELKVCTMAFTHGFAPLASDNLGSYTSRAREHCRKIGLIEPLTAGQQAKAASRTAPKADAPKAAKASGELTMAMAFEKVGHGDAALADKLAWAAGDGRAFFEAWYAKTMAILAA